MWNSKGDPMMVPDSWWLDGQPDDHFGDQDCLTMLWFGQLDDYRCDAYTDNVMCQKCKVCQKCRRLSRQSNFLTNLTSLTNS